MQHKNVLKDDIWQDDLLGRQQDSRFLIDFLTRRSKELAEGGQAKSYVLNINSEWGQGKTFFLTRVTRQLEKESYIPVYINAWSDDHAQDPLVAVIAALDEAFKPFVKRNPIIKRAWDATRSNGLRIVGTALIHGSKQGIKKLIGESGGDAISEIVGAAKSKKSEVQEVAETTIAATVDELVDGYSKSLIRQFNKSKSSTQTFKVNLQKLLDASKGTGKNLPLFIIIDELDRCRPTYAVQLLERIKHLFDVPNVVFIVATDTEQLCCSVNAVYGSNFDSKRYLLRFFDQTYSFSRPELNGLIRKIFDEKRINEDLLEAPFHEPISFITSMLFETKASLRDVEQCLDMLENIITVWSLTCKIQLLYLLPLILAYQRGQSEVFDALAKHSVEHDKILETLIPRTWQIQFPGQNYPRRQGQTISVVELIKRLCAKLKMPLSKASEGSDDESSLQLWLRLQFDREFMLLGRVPRDKQSVMTDYPRLVQQVGRLSRAFSTAA